MNAKLAGCGDDGKAVGNASHLPVDIANPTQEVSVDLLDQRLGRALLVADLLDEERRRGTVILRRGGTEIVGEFLSGPAAVQPLKYAIRAGVGRHVDDPDLLPGGGALAATVFGDFLQERELAGR